MMASNAGSKLGASWRGHYDRLHLHTVKRHSSLPFFTDVRKRGGRMLVDVTVGVPDPASVDVERVRRELPHGEVTVHAQSGGLRVPGFDTLIACVAITVSVDEPS